MDKLNKKQRTKMAIGAVVSIVMMLSIMFIEIKIPGFLNNHPISGIFMLISIISGFYCLFGLIIDFPNHY